MNTTGSSRFVRTALGTLALATSAATTTAWATSTIEHTCTTGMVSSTGVRWTYTFAVTSTLGTEGGPSVRENSARLSARGFDPKMGQVFADFYGAPLNYTGSGASYLAFELPGSVHGLWVNFYPGADLDDAILIFHNLSESETLLSDDFICSVEEIG